MSDTALSQCVVRRMYPEKRPLPARIFPLEQVNCQTHRPIALSLGEGMSNSGVFISRRTTGEGLVAQFGILSGALSAAASVSLRCEGWAGTGPGMQGTPHLSADG